MDAQNCETCRHARYHSGSPAAFDTPPEPGWYRCTSESAGFGSVDENEVEPSWVCGHWETPVRVRDYYGNLLN